MEVDEGNKQQRVYDSDLDDDKKEQQNEDEKQDTKAKKKANRKPVVKFDATFLMDNPNGLKSLYKNFVVDFDKNVQLKGKGHELSDFNKVMNIYRNWHFQA